MNSSWYVFLFKYLFAIHIASPCFPKQRLERKEKESGCPRCSWFSSVHFYQLPLFHLPRLAELPYCVVYTFLGFHRSISSWKFFSDVSHPCFPPWSHATGSSVLVPECKMFHRDLPFSMPSFVPHCPIPTKTAATCIPHFPMFWVHSNVCWKRFHILFPFVVLWFLHLIVSFAVMLIHVSVKSRK